MSASLEYIPRFEAEAEAVIATSGPRLHASSMFSERHAFHDLQSSCRRLYRSVKSMRKRSQRAEFLNRVFAVSKVDRLLFVVLVDVLSQLFELIFHEGALELQPRI